MSALKIPLKFPSPFNQGVITTTSRTWRELSKELKPIFGVKDDEEIAGVEADSFGLRVVIEKWAPK